MERRNFLRGLIPAAIAAKAALTKQPDPAKAVKIVSKIADSNVDRDGERLTDGALEMMATPISPGSTGIEIRRAAETDPYFNSNEVLSFKMINLTDI